MNTPKTDAGTLLKSAALFAVALPDTRGRRRKTHRGRRSCAPGGHQGGEQSARPYNDQDDAEPLLEHYAHTQDAGTMNGGFSQKAA